MYVLLLEGALVILVGAFVLTQVVFPALDNRRLFPLFRRAGRLERQLTDVHEREAEHDLESELNRAARQAAQRKERLERELKRRREQL